MENQFFSSFQNIWAGGRLRVPQPFPARSQHVFSLRAVSAPRLRQLQEIPAGAAGVKGEQDGWASSDFYGVLGTDRDQTAAST